MTDYNIIQVKEALFLILIYLIDGMSHLVQKVISWSTWLQHQQFVYYCANNQVDMVIISLARGVDVNRNGFFYLGGWTAALLASNEGHTEIVRILAETGRVDWNKGNIRDMIPLYWALEAGCSGIVDIIVKQPNIDWNYRIDFDDDGDTLAHAALMGGDEKCVETLAALEIFDCWNLPNKDGDTPVMGAVKRNWTEIVEILLRCPRVDLNCRDKKGLSLVFRAVQCGNFGE